jgi:hypothetical protein
MKLILVCVMILKENNMICLEKLEILVFEVHEVVLADFDELDE